LWPICAQRPFDRFSRLLPEELRSRVETAEDVVLVTSPAHLKRLVNYDSLDWIRRKLRAVFSSGGRLSFEVAKKAEERLGCLPYEVLGSTETGGIAWRQQSCEGALWTPMDKVTVRSSERGTLEVQSPYVSPDGDQWHDTGDYVEIEPNDRFHLGDRADRVVNVAEKKVSLPEMETRAEEHSDVAEASAVVLRAENHPNRRRIVALAVRVAGQQSPDARDDLKKNIRDHLQPHFEPVTLPRRWRFVDELPRDSQGKVTVEALRSLFEDGG
jgi:acyl-coenzyme A synthetase/AMP-(fatty) acid ligase